MVIELAGVPAEVICRYSENERFLREYRSNKPPLFSVVPSEADLWKTQADFDRLAELEGTPRQKYSKSFLENNAIHALLAEALVEHGVLLMHGSALCMDGLAYLFTAKSGTGKSTHARLWREAFGERVWMINDDKPLLKIGVDRITVHAAPWDGRHHLSRNAKAPLKAIVSLERGEANRIEPMRQADAFPVLLTRCYASRNPAVMARIMELEKRLLHTVDFYRMDCNMSPGAATVAWEGMNAR